MNLKRDFKGIWIPRKIWCSKILNITEKAFLSEIDSLDNGDGCYANNKHFSEWSGLSKNRCSELINVLEKKSFISIENNVLIKGEYRRKITVNTPFGISTDPSESRQTPSESRQTPSESRQAIYKDLDIHLVIQEREARALDYLFMNYEIRFTESFLMPCKSQIKNFKKFWQDFNDTADIEKLEYSDRVLFPRLMKYTRNWIQNQDKFSGNLKVVQADADKRTNPNLGNAI